MTLDKFARHISKRYKINDIKDLVQKVENQVSNNISNNLNYIEDKVVEHFKYESQKRQLEISNFQNELNAQHKRSLVNTDNIDNMMKKIKFCEDELTTLKTNIEKINKIMNTKVKEVVFFNTKEKIKALKKDVGNLIIIIIIIIIVFIENSIQVIEYTYTN